ncbi:MAG: hypothetical protein ACU833_01395 [Gammaproteobacteria bacterium]
MIGSRLNPNLVILLLAISGVLAAVIVAEWSVMKVMRNGLLAEVARTGDSGYQIDEIPTIELMKTSIDDFADMVNRPLFVEGRRPIEEQEVGETEPENIYAGKFEWELTGVFSTVRGLSALFLNTKAREKTERFAKVFVNDDLEGWKIEAIYEDRVSISRGGETQEIQLRKPKPQNAPPPQRLHPRNKKEVNSGNQKPGEE